MVSAKDDEPPWVKEFYRRAVRGFIVVILLFAAIAAIGIVFFTNSMLQFVFIFVGLIPSMYFFRWAREKYPPVQAWHQAWLKEHQQVNGERGSIS